MSVSNKYSQPKLEHAVNAIKNHVAQLCKRFDVHTLYAFGSRAQEAKRFLDEYTPLNQTTQSDLDIGVKTGKAFPLTLKEKVSLAQGLEDLFDVSRVDLIDLKQADAFLAADVIRGERLFSVDEREADEYDLFILRRAGDLAYLERQRMDIILARDTSGD
jgi:predicted nucleotidyltransferase